MKSLIVSMTLLLTACGSPQPHPSLEDLVALGDAQSGSDASTCSQIRRLYILAIPLSDGLQHDPGLFEYSEHLLKYYDAAAAPTFISIGCDLTAQYSLDVLQHASKYIENRRATVY